MLLSVTTLAEHERGLVIVELTEMVEHERKIATTAALAPSPCRADPATPDPLQRLAAEDAAAVAALLACRRPEREPLGGSCAPAGWCYLDATRGRNSRSTAGQQASRPVAGA
jgi:hypothetical protein